MTPRPRSAAEFRRFVLAHHPDRGGDPEVFAAGVAAWRQAQRPSARPAVVFYRRRRRRDRLLALLRPARLRPAALLHPSTWTPRRPSRHVERRVR